MKELADKIMALSPGGKLRYAADLLDRGCSKQLVHTIVRAAEAQLAVAVFPRETPK